MYMRKPEVKDLIEKRDWTKLRELATKWPIADVAELLVDLEKPDRVMFYRSLPRPLAAEVFAFFESYEQDVFLRDLTDEEARNLMENLAPDDRTALLEELPAEVTQRLLSFLGADDLKQARQLLGYPEESVGRLMTPDYVSVRPEWTVSQTMEEIRNKGRDSETINAIYVTDLAFRLVGSVALRQVVLGNPTDRVRGIMRAPPVSVSAFEDREEAARLMERYDLSVLPVVDSQGVLVGIVTGDDVFEIAREETTEDFHKAAGVAPLHVSLKDAKAGLIYKSRIVWLLGLVGVYLVSGNIMSRFEDIIAKVVPLVFFLPLLIDSAGNAGSQSATLMVRALATGDVEPRDWARVLFREIGLAIALGATMGITVWAVAAYRVGPAIGIVAGASMVVVVLVACLVGITIPFVLDKLGLDPAAASSPFVTSVADILGVLVYFSMAKWVLGI
ncbi:MAG: magnesium transporter [Bacillota bacterium]